MRQNRFLIKKISPVNAKTFFSIVIKMFHMKHFGDDVKQNKKLTHMSAAALSAAVDTTKPIGEFTQLTGGTK